MKNKLFKASIYTLIIAAYLFSPGDIFGQADSSQKNYRVKIIKDEDGEKTNIDKSFKSEKELNEFLSEEGIELHSSDDDEDAKVMMYKFHHGDEELTEEMEVSICSE